MSMAASNRSSVKFTAHSILMPSRRRCFKIKNKIKKKRGDGRWGTEIKIAKLGKKRKDVLVFFSSPFLD